MEESDTGGSPVRTRQRSPARLLAGQYPPQRLETEVILGVFGVVPRSSVDLIGFKDTSDVKSGSTSRPFCTFGQAIE